MRRSQGGRGHAGGGGGGGGGGALPLENDSPLASAKDLCMPSRQLYAGTT